MLEVTEMIFTSNEFTTSKSDYRKARKELLRQIKKTFQVKGPLRLPRNVIILQVKLDNGKWATITDCTCDMESYTTWQGIKRLVTLDLKRG